MKKVLMLLIITFPLLIPSAWGQTEKVVRQSQQETKVNRNAYKPIQMTKEQYFNRAKQQISQEKELADYRKAADMGHAEAMYQVGLFYARGEGGVSKDEKEALVWIAKAAKAGCGDAKTDYEKRMGAQALAKLQKEAEQEEIERGLMVVLNNFHIGKWGEKLYDCKGFSVRLYNEIAIIYSGLTKPQGDIILPYKAKLGAKVYEVRKIGYQAFMNCTDITSVQIPDGIEEISEEAFKGCSSLKDVVIPATVKELEKAAFRECGLESVTIPEGIVRLYPKLFYNCKNLIQVNLPNSLKYIDESVFLNCKGLETINLPEGTRVLGFFCFQGCSSLKSIDLPSTVEGMGNGVFYGCTSLETVHLSDKLLTMSTGVFAKCISLTSIELPEKCGLSAECFEGCINLTSVTMAGKNLEWAPTSAFRGCVKLDKIKVRNPDGSTKFVKAKKWKEEDKFSL